MDREPTELEKTRMIEAQLIAEAYAEREAVGDRARATIQRQEGEAKQRHDQEDREREMGVRCR